MRFYSSKELISFLKKELELSNRFPTIFVFFERLRSFKELLDFLKIRARLLNLADFCPQKDLTPLLSLQAIKDILCKETSPLCILPFCAWWRLKIGLPSAQMLLKELATFENKNCPRLVIPLFDPERRIFPALAELSRSKDNEGALFLRLEETPKPYSLCISFPIKDFKPLGFHIFDGIQEFLAYFSHPSSEEENFWLFTQAVKAIKASPLLEVLSSTEKIVRKLFPDLSISASFDETFWKALLIRSSFFKTRDFNILVQKIFSVSQIDALFLLEKWKKFGEFEKKLAIFWAINQKEKDIWTEILANSTPDNLVEKIYFTSFPLSDLEQRKTILRKLGPYPFQKKNLPQNFWARLRLLTDISREERWQILKIIREFLNDSEVVPEKALEILEVNFPLLAFYLESDESNAGQYFTRYRLGKLTQKKLSWPSLSLETFPTREEEIARSGVSAKQQIWIDGLGGEWIGVLKRFLERVGVSFSSSFVRANLPTITETNRPPKEVSFWRELDEVGHKYRPDPLETILLEFEEMERILSRLQERIFQGNRLLITGDHGLTWSFFHDRKIPLPEGADEPHRAGRVARVRKLTKAVVSSDLWKTDREDKYLCLTRHGYFEGSKRPPQGEFHGGALPEEVLVPLIEISQKTEADFSFRLLKPEVRLDAQGKVSIELEIEPQPKERVWLLIAEKKILLQRRAAEFIGEIEGLAPDTYKIRVLVGGKSIGTAEIKVLPPAIIEDDLGF